MASLGQALNRMAAELQSARTCQMQLETQRRDMVAWVGHDLRTPLTSIRAILEALGD